MRRGGRVLAGLIGGGGSVLAVPLLLYVVGMPDPHMAIGTSALAVAANAFANLGPHARAGNVRWGPARCSLPAACLALMLVRPRARRSTASGCWGRFALLMMVIAALMQKPRRCVVGGPI